MAHWLASIQAHGCFLQYGWRLSSRQLRRLAAHLALAASAGWVVASENRLALRRTVYGWLCQRPAAQIDGLLAALTDPVNWRAAVERFRLQELPGVDMQTYLQQQLARSRPNARPSRARHPLQRYLLQPGVPFLSPQTLSGGRDSRLSTTGLVTGRQSRAKSSLEQRRI